MLEDLIPDRETTEDWDELEDKEQRARLFSLVAELPTAQRQAFMLYALEDYDPAEISMLQGRPESKVRADIEAARRTLRDRLRAQGHLQEAGEPVGQSGAATEAIRN
jgi:RNA polymerase sigma factor (sigma-70 family)